MKKIVLLAVAALVSTGAFAQDWAKGDKFIKASTSSLDAVFVDNDGDADGYFNLNVGGGYFFTEKLAADVELGVDLYKADKDADMFTVFNFGVGVRYYFWNNLYGRLGYEGEKMKDIDMTSYASIEAGYDWFLSEKVFFEPALYFKKGLGDIDKTNEFGLKIGIGVRF